jgi:D-glycero-D-manno-heptose 1,7-bisphosphate phosphatase
MDKFIVLDRDGVINEDSDDFIKSPAEWMPIQGSLEAIAHLHQRGVRVVVLTNQSGIARGLFDQPTLDAIHDKMRAAVRHAGGEITDIFFCPHGPDDGCVCRKPLPGLFHQLALRQHIAVDTVYAVGDSYRDLEAAWAVQAKPVLVKTGKGQKTLKAHPDLLIPVYAHLHEAVLDLYP